MKIKTGNIYLARDTQGTWRIISQISLRQWVAAVFTHATKYSEDEHNPFIPAIQKNAQDMSVVEWTEIHEIPLKQHGAMRSMMFNILKTGKV